MRSGLMVLRGCQQWTQMFQLVNMALFRVQKIAEFGFQGKFTLNGEGQGGQDRRGSRRVKVAEKI